MDMSKAKNILIIAFTIINIFLALELKDLKTQYKDEGLVINDKLIEDVVSLLAKKDINLNTDIPKDTPTMNTISIEYEKYDPKTIAEIFFDDYSQKEQEEVIYFRDNDKILTVTNNKKTIIYEDLSEKNKLNNEEISKQIAIDSANSFIKNKNFSTEDYELSSIKEEDGIYKLEYNKIYKGIEVEESYMKIEVNKSGVIHFERYWISNITENRSTSTISSASKALLRILTKQDYYGKTIESINLCYYFNINNYKNKSFKDTRGGNANPAWKIIFDDGSKLYLEDI